MSREVYWSDEDESFVYEDTGELVPPGTPLFQAEDGTGRVLTYFDPGMEEE